MDDFFKQIFVFIDTRGLAMTIVVLGMYWANRWLALWYEQQRRPTKQNISPEDLMAHEFFYRLAQFSNVDLPTLNIANPFKRQLAIHMMTRYWMSINDALRVTISDDINKLSKEQFHQRIADSIGGAMNKCYESLVKDDKVPDIAVNELRKYRARAERFFFHETRSYFKAPMLTTNTIRLMHIMNTLQHDLDTCIYDVQELFVEMNGHLTGAEWRGMTYEHAGAAA